MKVHITGFFYKLDKKATPFLKIVKEDNTEHYLPLNRNKTIQVLKDFGKKCTGYYKNGEFHACPSNEEISYGKQCNKCRKMDDFNTCAKCTGQQCNASAEIMKNCLNKTHFMYLTIIGEKIKVGVTKAGRYLKRWVEQGSDYSCIISSGNGLDIRRKEHLLAKEISDRISNKEKVQNFMKDDLSYFEEFLKEKKLDVPIINVRRYYEGLDSIPSEPTISTNLNGRIVCVKGKIIVYENNEKYYYYDLNNLISNLVEINYT
ncbi:MAG: DUF2797 domain-containing protein [Nanoarchaeota archaeon]|nr:DUF2797 domain-containing protein [Nanoarchaeota archaeon]